MHCKKINDKQYLFDLKIDSMMIDVGLSLLEMLFEYLYTDVLQFNVASLA